MTDLEEEIQRVAANHNRLSLVTKKSLRESWGLDLDEYDALLKNVKPRLKEEQSRQRKLRKERRNGYWTDPLEVKSSCIWKNIKRELGREDDRHWTRPKDTRRNLAEQEKGVSYVIPCEDAPLGVLLVRGEETVREVEDYYSKAWHRKYGPRRIVDGRAVVLYKIDIWTGDRTEINRHEDRVENGFQGDWLIDSLSHLYYDAGGYRKRLARPLKWQSEQGRSLRKVQKNPNCRVEKTAEKSIIGDQVRIYKRTAAGLIVDWCGAFVNERGTVKNVVHASTEEAAREKIWHQVHEPVDDRELVPQ